eukprot:TRINITY_DN10778_c0_g2_i2.p1 TRINITY_DN10778_c0_g2~~TRINITY_DN10778_c0_g2_i2.p1  ORF type:complete len:605 (-),score=104.81 TRINITY_DN10778_c0_g2_i2:139-1953(-)
MLRSSMVLLAMCALVPLAMGVSFAPANNAALRKVHSQSNPTSLTTGATVGSQFKPRGIPLQAVCPVCLGYLPKAVSELTANSTQQEIIAALEKVCHIIPTGTYRQECETYAQSIGGLLNAGVYQNVKQKYTTRAMCTILSLCNTDCCLLPETPEQIHLTSLHNISEMQVQWTTQEPLGNATLMYDTVPVTNYTTGPPSTATVVTNAITARTYHAGAWHGWVYTATFSNLQPGTTYYYRVGDPETGMWSQPDLHFTTTTANNFPVTFGVVGDVGATDISDTSIARMTEYRIRNQIQAVLHVGDISYADLDQELWDVMMRKIQPIAAYIPYMVIPGNHETFFNFTAYDTRFAMPGYKPGSLNFWYSYDYGGVHVLAINTEGKNDALADISPGSPQYNFIKQDLIQANANRANVPWIIAMSHRPFYCSNNDTKDCTTRASTFRAYLEDLFYQYRVDLIISGHRHDYERTYPVYGGQVPSQSYQYPTAPVYVVNGASGCKEFLNGNFTTPGPTWAATRMSVFGNGLLTFTNASQLTWSYVEDATGNTIDSFTLTRNTSTPLSEYRTPRAFPQGHSAHRTPLTSVYHQDHDMSSVKGRMRGAVLVPMQK